jgi:hypothetical protein
VNKVNAWLSWKTGISFTGEHDCWVVGEGLHCMQYVDFYLLLIFHYIIL